MTLFQTLNLQSTFTLVAFVLIARWHFVPCLPKISVEGHLVPLAWVHVFRRAPLTLLVRGPITATRKFTDQENCHTHLFH